MVDIDRLNNDLPTRRAFLARMTAAGLGSAAAALLAGCGGGSSNANGNPNNIPDPTNFPGIPGRSVNEAVLNFALTLEILEANLYLQALNQASGRPLSTPLDASGPRSISRLSTGNYTQKVANGTINGALVQAGFLYLVQFAYVEAAHRDFLTTAISAGGGTPMTANAKGYQFPGGPGNDLGAILSNILPLEETGVRAYLGALPFLSDLGLAQTAGTIYSTEARHSASVAYILGKDPGPTPMSGDKMVQTARDTNEFETFLPPATVLNAASAYFIK